MSLAEAVPLPAWAAEQKTPDGDNPAFLGFIVRLAALYHNERGSLSTLSNAIGLSEPALHVALKRGRLSVESAIAIEEQVGREHFPRELFRPDLFLVKE